MPLEQPAIIEIVPVGATVIRQALRILGLAGRVADAAFESGEDAPLLGQLL